MIKKFSLTFLLLALSFSCRYKKEKIEKPYYKGFNYVSWHSGDYPYYLPIKRNKEIKLDYLGEFDNKKGVLKIAIQDEFFINLKKYNKKGADFRKKTIFSDFYVENSEGLMQLFLKDEKWRNCYSKPQLIKKGWNKIILEKNRKNVAVFDEEFNEKKVMAIGLKFLNQKNENGGVEKRTILLDKIDAYETKRIEFDFINPLDELKDIGVNSIIIANTEYLGTKYSSHIHPISGWTHTKKELVELIDEAKKRNLKIFLAPHLFYYGSGKRDFEPANKIEWLRNYENFIIKYAKIAKRKNLEGLIIGIELGKIATKDYDKWKEMIKKIREIYKGRLVYAALPNNYKKICFWNLVDIIGIDAYFPLSKKRNPSLEELSESWKKWIKKIGSWQRMVGKKIIFTEVGYRNIDFAARMPSDINIKAGYNEELQFRCYKALSLNLKEKPEWLQGIFFWRWSPIFDYGAVPNTSFSPQKKKALKVVEEF